MLNKSLIIVAFAAFIPSRTCATTWRDAYNRGSPTITSYCADPTYTKLADGLCYAPCPPNYPSSYGTSTCYALCPWGYTDTGGTTCSGTVTGYDRGIGRADPSLCPSNPGYDPALGCHRPLGHALWYPVCR